MTKKTYTSKSVASVRVQLGGGSSALVRFAPEIEGGSKFETTDTALQGALEAHPKYGKLFGLESSAESGESVTRPQVQYYGSDDPNGHAVRYTPQTLTSEEQAQARQNIGVPSELPTDLVVSTSVRTIVTLTQAQYDALATKDVNTEYNIIESV